MPTDLIGALARSGGAEAAIGLAELITDLGERVAAHIAAGAESVKAGQTVPAQRALSVAAALLKDAPPVSEPLIPVIAAFGELGDTDSTARMGSLVERLDRAEDQAAAVAAVVQAYAKCGDRERSLAWSERLPPDLAAITTACGALAGVGLRDEAIRLAERSPIPAMRASALAAIAAALARHGQLDEAIGPA